MSAAMLAWRTRTPSTSPLFMVKGAELSTALCGDFARFQIVETRCYDAEGHADRRYAVRDADLVSDAELRDGKCPPIVACFDDIEAAVRFCHE